MQGKRIVKIDGRDYLIERTFSSESAIYLAGGPGGPSYEHIPLINHVSHQTDIEPGTLVVILARVAAPSPEPEPKPDDELRLERRYYDEEHWEPVTWDIAKAVLTNFYRDLSLIRKDLEDGLTVDTNVARYRRRATNDTS